MTKNSDASRLVGRSEQIAADYQKGIERGADALAREIDKEILLSVGAWMDDDKDYVLGTREKYEEFVKKRNYSFGEGK